MELALPDNVFQLILEGHRGVPEIDLIATSTNVRLLRFYTCLQDPDALAQNAQPRIGHNEK